jgi:hypothetical protein
MGLQAHDLVTESPVRPLEPLESVVPVTNGRPQYLDLLASGLECRVLLLDGSVQRRDLVLQDAKASCGLSNLDVEGVVLTADQGDVLLELLHPC